MVLDTLKVLLSHAATHVLESAKADDFDRLLDTLAEFAAREGPPGDGCIGIRDFILGVRREQGSLEVHWIEPVCPHGERAAAHRRDRSPEEVASPAF